MYFTFLEWQLFEDMQQEDFEEFYKQNREHGYDVNGSTEKQIQEERNSLFEDYEKRTKELLMEYEKYIKKIQNLRTESDDKVICPFCGNSSYSNGECYDYRDGVYDEECSECNKEFKVSYQYDGVYKFKSFASECEKNKHSEVIWNEDIVEKNEKIKTWYEPYLETGVCVNCRKIVCRYYIDDRKLLSKKINITL